MIIILKLFILFTIAIFLSVFVSLFQQQQRNKKREREKKNDDDTLLRVSVLLMVKMMININFFAIYLLIYSLN